MIFEESLYFCKVTHRRFIPKKYFFNFYFYWFFLPLISLKDEKNYSKKYWPLFSRNKSSFFSFYELDHYKKNGLGLVESLTMFLEENNALGTRKIEQIYILTNPRILGYTFNPITFYFVCLSDKSVLSLVQICNTFNELKMFMGSEMGINNRFFAQAKKDFYISPFVPLDSMLKFDFSIPHELFQVNINDVTENKNLVLQTNLIGNRKKFNNINMLIAFFHIPFQNFLIITFIHFHALVLWMKGIKYYKKNENIEMQKGFQKWKS